MYSSKESSVYIVCKRRHSLDQLFSSPCDKNIQMKNRPDGMIIIPLLNGKPIIHSMVKIKLGMTLYTIIFDH